MTRTFQDHDFLVWEVFTSSGKYGTSDHAEIIFHCLTQRDLRPRHVPFDGDGASASGAVARVSDAKLLAMLESAPALS